MFDSANRWLSKRIAANRAQRQGEISVDASGIRIDRAGSSEAIRWRDVREIVAVRKDAFVGNNLVLILRCAGRREIKVMEYDPAWKVLCEGVNRHLPGSVPYPEWTLKAAFTDTKGDVIVYRSA